MVVVFSRLKDYFSSLTVHPDSKEAVNTALNAAHSFGAIDINDEEAVKCFQGFVKYASFSYPSISIEKLIDLTCYFSFYWLMDNYIDDNDNATREAIEKFSKATLYILKHTLTEDGEDAQEEWFGIIRAQYSILQKLKSKTPLFWFERFMDIMEQYLKICPQMYAIRNSNKQLGYEEYIESRLWDSGLYPALTLYEYALDIYLPDNIVNDERFKRATLLANSHVNFTSDIYSYERECINKEQNTNLVAVMMNNKNMTFQQAVDAIINMCNTWLDEIVQLKDELVADYGEGVGIIVHNYFVAIQGHKMFVMDSHRYRSDTSPFQDLKNKDD